jgi:hypothetical protein
MNAVPSVAELRASPFTPDRESAYQDDKRDVSVKVIAQRGESYEIQVSNGK